ncbi:MAG: PspA/IM30 family protein [Deltaproteobacteria bacterium]|nr:MAG: PspA/IM30 family protein [Deltaproteobacteria bacterium]
MLFQRFITLIKSYLNHWISLAEDPEKMLNQSLIEFQENLLMLKRQLAMAIADEKKMAVQFQEERAAMVHWGQRAELAAEEGNDLLTVQAIERQEEHVKLANQIENNWQMQIQSIDELKEAISKLQNQYSEAKRKKNLLIARARRAEAQKNISETLSGLKGNSSLNLFSKMEESINQLEAEAKVSSDLANELDQDALSMQFQKLEEPRKRNESLRILKQKLGILKETSSKSLNRYNDNNKN